jgi:flagellar basal-body rod protein FlgB
MFSSMFQSTTIPVLQEVVAFTQVRQTVLAGNIANVDTPGYQAKDLSVEEFQDRLKAAIAARDQAEPSSPGEPAGGAGLLAQVSTAAGSLLRHDLGNVNMEGQVTEMVQNHMQHNLALTLMTDQFHQLQTAISEKV